MKRNLVVEDDIEEGVVNRQAVVVVNSVPRLHSRGNGTLPFGNEVHSSPPAQAGLVISPRLDYPQRFFHKTLTLTGQGYHDSS